MRKSGYRHRHWQRVVLLLQGLAFCCVAAAHAPVSSQIDLLDRRIAESPAAMQLYIQRGNLYRDRHDWNRALADFEVVLEEAESHPAALLGKGRVLQEQGRPVPAIDILTRLLSVHPDHIRGRVIRAKAYSASNQHLFAAADYTVVIRLFSPPKKPLPEYFLERGKAYAAAGERYIDEALLSLDEGRAVFGEMPSLQWYAIELEKKRENFDGALQRIEPLLAGAGRKEQWYVEKASLLDAMGASEDAEKQLQLALGEIAALPVRHQNTPATMALRDKIIRQLAVMDGQ